MLLPFDPEVRRRQTAPGTSLGAIADALAAELAPWLREPLPVPVTKARLTRIGGRCPQHGVLLEFDPRAPHAHRCERCGRSYGEPEHHEWWAMGAHLFTAERAVHAAVLHLLRGEPAHRALAERTLQALAEQYAHWPNRDNVLGPTRPFFSTYLESIWLLNLSHALALLECAGPTSVGGTVRERLLAPSSALIAGYHEGRSNRQVWNEVAVLSAWTMLGEHARVRQRLDAPGSLHTLVAEGLLPDGTWFEGENYHQFAHRGLWYGVQLLDALGCPLDGALRSRYREGFVTPFAAMLPDETLPARRDSQYAVSLRQWRWAEWCELGYAFGGDGRLAAILARLYDGAAPAGPTGRDVSTADAERNRPAVALSRADCSWRALLMATADPVPPSVWSPGSVLQPRQGLAVLRREGGRVYVALDGGEQGGGHGHPDRLALTVQREAQRVLDDPGTGSYVERTLHWYRSTLAHHAPLVNGASQQRGTARLTAFEERGGAGWMQKVADEIAPGVTATRTVVVCDGYLVDTFEFSARHPVTVTLPLAANAGSDLAHWRPATRTGAGGLEDGFEFLSAVMEAVDAPSPVRFTCADAPGITGCYAAAVPCGAPVWWRATAPGAPASAPQERVMLDLHGTTGRCVGVWVFATHLQTVSDVVLTPDATVLAAVTTADGTTAAHEPAPHGWHIGLVARHARSSIDLEWLAPDDPDSSPPVPAVQVAKPAYSRRPALVTDGAALRHTLSHGPGSDAGHDDLAFVLGEAHYVQTEEPWGRDNVPTARVRVARTATDLLVLVDVHTGHAPVVPAAGHDGDMPANPLDNERADTNADGLQCYIGRAGQPRGSWVAGVLAVPLTDGRVRATSLVTGAPLPDIRSRTSPEGWRMRLRWPLAALPDGACTFDLVINERPPHRERRRGQLVLSGGGGFAYLRGDRHEPAAPLGLLLA